MTKDELIEIAQVGMGIHSPNAPEYIVCEALIKALAQPDQEPVAWIYEDELPEGYPYDAMFKKSRVIDGVRMFPVNVAPQRKPLTDEEIAEEFYKFEAAGAWYQFARAIEAAHNIK